MALGLVLDLVPVAIDVVHALRFDHTVEERTRKSSAVIAQCAWL